MHVRMGNVNGEVERGSNYYIPFLYSNMNIDTFVIKYSLLSLDLHIQYSWMCSIKHSIIAMGIYLQFIHYWGKTVGSVNNIGDVHRVTIKFTEGLMNGGRLLYGTISVPAYPLFKNYVEKICFILVHSDGTGKDSHRVY